MTQEEFQRQRNKLIRRYHITIRPTWDKYRNHLLQAHSHEPRRKACKAFREAIKPHLEHLFAQIAVIKQ